MIVFSFAVNSAAFAMIALAIAIPPMMSLFNSDLLRAFALVRLDYHFTGSARIVPSAGVTLPGAAALY